jgi:hypothetical protein
MSTEMTMYSKIFSFFIGIIFTGIIMYNMYELVLYVIILLLLITSYDFYRKKNL